ncbi:MAG: DHHA1 domain-containing protein, partial [Saprospiraceae bacterium]
LDTKKENDLVIHIIDKVPTRIEDATVHCLVDARKRRLTENNHSATHLMHAALRQVLGTHVQQKGSYLDENALRFDFAHFQKVTDEEIAEIERIVNEKIRENISLEEARNLPIEEARAAGAMMLFGEKYGETVRMITFDPAYSRELCGGCHVKQTGQIGLFKIRSESAVAAGVRRIEAITGLAVEAYLTGLEKEFAFIKDIVKVKEIGKAVADLHEENKRLKKENEGLIQQQANGLREGLRTQAEDVNGIRFVAAVLPIQDANALKNLAVELERELGSAVVAFGSISNDKPMLTVKISEDLVKSRGLNAGAIVRELAQQFLKGGGGGQPVFATAGGTDASKLKEAVEAVRGYLV